MTACEMRRPRQAMSRSSKRAPPCELARLGVGLAHEIRNPLHALRINLHTLRRSFTGCSPLAHDQLIATIEESDATIDRLDELLGDLLQYVAPNPGEPAEVDLVHAVQAALSLVADEMRREQISVHAVLPPEPATITIDPIRLRQSLVNVFTFARHRAGRRGMVEVRIERGANGVQISIGDSGCDLTEDQKNRLFEPFQAPTETGCGLGLALVQAYVEEAGGRVEWVREAGRAGRCHLWFPLAARESNGE